MFTGIVKGRGLVKEIINLTGLSKISIELPKGCDADLEQGASIAIDGVCLTVTSISRNLVTFDVMQETLQRTTLHSLQANDQVNIERSAKAGVEVGGHILSGHIDCTAKIVNIEKPDNNYVLTFQVPSQFMRYIFSKGFIALNGTSLTITAANKEQNTFSVWFVPETLRATTFELKKIGEDINMEVERNTQVTVDTIRDYLDEKLEQLIPSLLTKQALQDSK